MIRLRLVLAAAATLFNGGGITLPVALRDAGLNAAPAMSCAEWAQRTTDVSNSEPPIEWFVAVINGFAPPPVAGAHVIGDCVAGTCTLQPQGCAASATYTYQQSPLVSGWRLFRVRGPRYFAVGWRALAAAQSASVHFYEGWGQVATDCLAHFVAADCRTLADGAGVCWKRAGGLFCRGGLLYGPGQGGSSACSAQAGDVPYPCNVVAGVDPDRLAIDAFPSDLDLDR